MLLHSVVIIILFVIRIEVSFLVKKRTFILQYTKISKFSPSILSLLIFLKFKTFFILNSSTQQYFSKEILINFENLVLKKHYSTYSKLLHKKKRKKDKYEEDKLCNLIFCSRKTNKLN